MLYFSTKTGNGGRGAEGVRQGAIPNARHHRFSVSCKLRILRKANGCAGSSAVGALLRKGEGGGGDEGSPDWHGVYRAGLHARLDVVPLRRLRTTEDAQSAIRL